MSERVTAVSLPGGRHPGFADWGEHEPGGMIEKYRRYAAEMIAQGQEILGADDSDFRVEAYRGVHVRRGLRVLQPGRALAQGS